MKEETALQIIRAQMERLSKSADLSDELELGYINRMVKLGRLAKALDGVVMPEWAERHLGELGGRLIEISSKEILPSERMWNATDAIIEIIEAICF